VQRNKTSVKKITSPEKNLPSAKYCHCTWRQRCGAGAQAIFRYGARAGAWYLGSGSTEIVCWASELDNTFFSVQWTKSFWGRIQKLLDVGAGAKKFRCLELEPEMSVPAPQPCLTGRGKNAIPVVVPVLPSPLVICNI